MNKHLEKIKQFQSEHGRMGVVGEDHSLITISVDWGDVCAQQSTTYTDANGIDWYGPDIISYDTVYKSFNY